MVEGGQGGDLLLHSVGDTGVHGGASGEDSVGVQVLPDIDVALHDGVVGGLVDAAGRTCTPTLSSPEAPPCTPVSPTECRRRSPPWPPQRSRSLLPQRGSTPSGSEAPSWLPSPPSSRCGSPSRSTTSAAPPSCTGSASKRFSNFVQRIHSFDISISSYSTKHNFNKYTQ